MNTKRYIQELPDGGFRDVTEEELASAKAMERRREMFSRQLLGIEAELRRIRNDCKHPVSYDKEGHPYNVRVCIVCGVGTIL